MNQIDPRCLELIHAELDGTLDAGAAAELQQHLQANPAAASMRAQFHRMQRQLALLESHTPPASLRAEILQGIDGRSRIIPFPQRGTRLVRLSLAMAATVGFVALGIGMLRHAPVNFEPAQLTGTIGRDRVRLPISALPHPVSAPGLQGSVGLDRGDRGWQLVFDLQADVAVEVRVSTLEGDIDPAATSPPVSGAMIDFAAVGAHRSEHPIAIADRAPIRIHFLRDGERVAELLLEPPAEAEPP